MRLKRITARRAADGRLNIHGAQIRYSAHPEAHEVFFDLPRAHFGHVGNQCTFETIVQSFGLDDPALRRMAEVVHELDLRDAQSRQPYIAGIDAVLSGWQAAHFGDDHERYGIALFKP